jgi:hypothetical protein
MIFIDSFSGAAVDLKPAHRTPAKVLAVLAKYPRVSIWDMSENPWLCGCIDILKRDGMIVEDKSEPYPWFRFNVVEQASKEVVG